MCIYIYHISLCLRQHVSIQFFLSFSGVYKSNSVSKYGNWKRCWRCFLHNNWWVGPWPWPGSLIEFLSVPNFGEKIVVELSTYGPRIGSRSSMTCRRKDNSKPFYAFRVLGLVQVGQLKVWARFLLYSSQYSLFFTFGLCLFSSWHVDGVALQHFLWQHGLIEQASHFHWSLKMATRVVHRHYQIGYCIYTFYFSHPYAYQYMNELHPSS